MKSYIQKLVDKRDAKKFMPDEYNPNTLLNISQIINSYVIARKTFIKGWLDEGCPYLWVNGRQKIKWIDLVNFEEKHLIRRRKVS